MITPEECNGNPSKTVACRETLVIAVAVPHDFVYCDHARQRPGYGHCQDNLSADGNPGVLGSRSTRARGSYFITPLCPPEEDIDKGAGKQRKDERCVYRNALWEPRYPLA